eukprot:542931-Amphidinium_carterae.1
MVRSSSAGHHLYRWFTCHPCSSDGNDGAPSLTSVSKSDRQSVNTWTGKNSGGRCLCLLARAASTAWSHPCVLAASVGRFWAGLNQADVAEGPPSNGVFNHKFQQNPCSRQLQLVKHEWCL